jgi:hypothetical protein
MTQTAARSYEVAGRQLTCQVCDHDRFAEREVRLNTAVSAVFGPDWANTKATCRVCARCGFVHWFLPAHEAAADLETTDLGRELEALRRSLDDLYDQPVEEFDEALT